MTTAQILWLPVTFVLGSAIGSFLNVCIWRLPRRCLGIFRPRRSFCPSCMTKIALYDNLPILSWLMLRGRCRHCRGRISARYLLVEALTGSLFALFFYLRVVRADPPEYGLLAVHMLFASAIIACSFIDWEWMIIPDRINKPGMVLAPILGPKQACPEANPRGIGRLSGKDRLPPVGDPVAS